MCLRSFSALCSSDALLVKTNSRIVKKHGARDAIAFYVSCWLLALCRGSKIGIYCSDVSGAFDRVSADRMVRKLAAYGVNTRLLNVIRSWLRDRKARIVVAGSQSEEFRLSNMLFQGTVWGPPLWNAFFGDASCVLRSLDFTVVIYADDYNAFRFYPRCAHNRLIMSELREFQCELHKWGRGNQVQFDAGKESLLIMAQDDAEGDSIRLLGVDFDGKLRMTGAVRECVDEASWRLRTLLRTQRYHTDAELLLLFKSHILSYLEYRTPAIYHACTTILDPLNRVLRNFLRQINVSEIDALLRFNLPPLSTRRDIAMLGVIHRAALRMEPKHFWQWIRFDTSNLRRSVRMQRNTLRLLLEVSDAKRSRMGRHSMFGLIWVYNLLPNSVVEHDSVQAFQTALTDLLKDLARSGYDMWPDLFSCRVEYWRHPLRRFPD